MATKMDIDSSSMDETRSEVVFFVQKDIFEQQAAKLNSYVANSDSLDTSIDKNALNALATSAVFDDAFQSRYPGKTNNTNSTSVLNDTEMSLLRILDGDGEISLNVKMDTFITLMNTKIDSNEHRTLILDILSVYTTPQCQLHFVKKEGYKILKNWLITALKAGNVKELSTIVTLCLDLPFDKKAITEADIGKKIKELKSCKFASALAQPVNSLMENWRAQNSKSKSITIPTKSSDTENSNINERKERVQQFLSVLNKEFYNAVPVIKTASSISHVNPSLSTTINTDSVDNSSIKPSLSVDTSLSMSSNSSNNDKNQSPSNKGTKRKVDMAQIARNLAASSGVDSTSSTGSNNGSADSSAAPGLSSGSVNSTSTSGSSKEGGDMSDLPHRNGTKPGKSCLKKANDSKTKSVITWADRKGGNLREIQTFEIDKPKGMRSTEGYNVNKSHREREKRERMMEKAVQTNKKKDAMQRAVEWETPGELKFELAIVDNCHNDVTSEQLKIQNKRVESVLEARYMDESLIPQDPGHLEGKDDGDDTNAVMKVVNVSFQTGVIRDIDLPIMPSMPSMGMAPPTMPGSMGGVPPPTLSMPTMTVPPPMNPLYSAVPPQFHGLEPALLTRISQDQNLMMSLLNPDGSLNETQISVLRMQSQQNTVMSAPSFQSHPGMAPPPPMSTFSGGLPSGGMAMPPHPPPFQQQAAWNTGIPLPPPGTAPPPTLRVPGSMPPGGMPPGGYPGMPVPPNKRARR